MTRASEPRIVKSNNLKDLDPGYLSGEESV